MLFAIGSSKSPYIKRSQFSKKLLSLVWTGLVGNKIVWWIMIQGQLTMVRHKFSWKWYLPSTRFFQEIKRVLLLHPMHPLRFISTITCVSQIFSLVPTYNSSHIFLHLHSTMRIFIGDASKWEHEKCTCLPLLVSPQMHIQDEAPSHTSNYLKQQFYNQVISANRPVQRLVS